MQKPWVSDFFAKGFNICIVREKDSHTVEVLKICTHDLNIGVIRACIQVFVNFDRVDIFVADVHVPSNVHNFILLRTSTFVLLYSVPT